MKQPPAVRPRTTPLGMAQIAAAVTTLTGTVLPWEEAGARNSYTLFSTIQRLGVLETLPALETAAGAWALVPLLAMAACAGHMLHLKRTASLLGIPCALFAVVMAAGVLAAPVTHGVGISVTAIAAAAWTVLAAATLIAGAVGRKRATTRHATPGTDQP